MTEETYKKKKKRYYPKNKEWASKNRKPKDLKIRLEELQAHINSKYHTP